MTFYTACWSWGKSQWAAQHLGCNCMAWPACLLATSWLLPWLLSGAAASCGCGHAVVCLERGTVTLPLALWVPDAWGGPCIAWGLWPLVSLQSLNTRLGKGDNQAPSLDKPSIICSESALSHTVPGPSWWNSGDQSSRLTSKAG